MSLAYPLIAWGAADDIAAAPWSSANTPIVTGGQVDPFGGTGATLVNDDAAGAVEYRLRTIAFLGTSAMIGIMAKQGSATTSHATVSDAAEAVGRSRLQLDWTAGVPAASTTFGTVFSPISLGAGWYLMLWFITSGLTGTDKLLLYGATDTAGTTGSTYWYLRNLVLLEVPSRPVGWDDQREGSETYELLDGTADAALFARDYRFTADIRMIPSAPRSAPQIVSGWEGANDSIGVNCGVDTMLTAGQDARTLVFVPDRSDCATSISSELVHPVEGDEPTPMPDGSRGIALELRNTTTPYPGFW